MGIVNGVCNSTHEHGSHCPPTVKNAFHSGVNSKGKQDLMCLCGAPSPLKKDLSFQGGLLKSTGVVPSLSVFLERKLNLTCKTITERKASAISCMHPLLLSIF